MQVVYLAVPFRPWLWTNLFGILNEHDRSTGSGQRRFVSDQNFGRWHLLRETKTNIEMVGGCNGWAPNLGACDRERPALRSIRVSHAVADGTRVPNLCGIGRIRRNAVRRYTKKYGRQLRNNVVTSKH